jgi:hypothetical protein
MSSALKRRAAYALASASVLAMGLLWRSHLLIMPPFLRKYGGDALWAALVFALMRACRPSAAIAASAAMAFGFSVAVELSQLFHAPWIETLRGFRLGRLVLGSTFSPPDILAYAVGILLAAGADWCAQNLSRQRP